MEPLCTADSTPLGIEKTQGLPDPSEVIKHMEQETQAEQEKLSAEQTRRCAELKYDILHPTATIKTSVSPNTKPDFTLMHNQRATSYFPDTSFIANARNKNISVEEKMNEIADVAVNKMKLDPINADKIAISFAQQVAPHFKGQYDPALEQKKTKRSDGLLKPKDTTFEKQLASSADPTKPFYNQSYTLAGVCGNIHLITAHLYALAVSRYRNIPIDTIATGILSIGAGDPHAITWIKVDDGYFFINYDNSVHIKSTTLEGAIDSLQQQAKNGPQEMQGWQFFAAGSNHITYVTDHTGKVISAIQSPVGKAMADSISPLGQSVDTAVIDNFIDPKNLKKFTSGVTGSHYELGSDAVSSVSANVGFKGFGAQATLGHIKTGSGNMTDGHNYMGVGVSHQFQKDLVLNNGINFSIGSAAAVLFDKSIITNNITDNALIPSMIGYEKFPQKNIISAGAKFGGGFSATQATGLHLKKDLDGVQVDTHLGVTTHIIPGTLTNPIYDGTAKFTAFGGVSAQTKTPNNTTISASVQGQAGFGGNTVQASFGVQKGPWAANVTGKQTGANIYNPSQSELTADVIYTLPKKGAKISLQTGVGYNSLTGNNLHVQATATIGAKRNSKSKPPTPQ